ncbi:phage tail protein [Paracoccus simplex]|uniref:Phage tail protein n=1 Tax=Paracoccus simplex TaxID=2086346 RepID=A0ABV7RWI8_9RHOB
MKKILVLAALAIGIAGPAHAGPIVAAVTWIGNAMAAGGVLGALTRVAVGIGASLLSSAISKATMDKPKVDIQFQVDFGDDTPLSFVAGDYVTAGKLKYIGSWGKNNRYITEVIEVSCLPQPGLQAMWVDDEKGVILGTTDTDGTSYNLGYPVTNYDDDGHRIWVRWIGGTQTAADSMLVSLFGSDPDYPWTAAMIGTGKSYAVVTTRYDSDTLTSKPSYLFQPQPLPLYDPRKDSTAGGSGAHRWGNRSTYEPTRNPAVIAYNIARGIYYGGEWIFGGRNLPAWRLPLAEWFAAMNACDASVSLAGGGTEPAFRCGLQVSADMTAADVLEEIGRAANMRFAEVGGKLKPIVGLPGAAVFAFTDDSILITEGQSYKPFNGLGDTFNALTATYPEPDEKWSSKDAPEYVDADATAADGGRYLPTSLSYPAAPYRRQVQRLMRAQMRDYRRMRLHQFHLPPEAYALEPLVDMVSWSSKRNGYINKLFVVESVSPTPGMNVLVTLREVDPSDYDWTSDFELPTTVVTPVVVRPWTQPISGYAVTGETITDASSRARAPAIRVSCSGDEVGVTHIQIQVRKNGTTDPYMDVQRPFNAPFIWRILDVVPQTTYQVRARLISDLTPKSSWTAWVNATTPAIYLDDGDFVGGVIGLFESAGLKATRIIANLTVPGTEVGELAWNLADSRLYRWNGTAWVHFIQESVTGMLDETAFAANIRVPEVVSSLPTTGQRPGDMVVLSSNSRLYRYNGTAWVDQAAADQIVGQLTAAQIAAGAIGADQLAAQSVAARHLLVADFTNLVPNADISDAGSWVIPSPWVRNISGDSFAGAYWTRLDVPGGGGMSPSVGSGLFAVDAGRELFARIQMRSDGATQQIGARAFIRFFKTDNTIVSDVNIKAFNVPIDQFPKWYSSTITVPATATRARIIWLVDYGNSTVGGRVFIASPEVRIKNGGELIVDGTIRGVHIEAETITGGLLASSGIITNSAQIENSVIQNAHIGNAEIRGAKIADLTVDTINIKDGAVTQRRNSKNSAGVSTDNTVTRVVVVNLAWNSLKAGVHLQSFRLWSPSNGGGADTLHWQALLDGEIVGQGSLSNNRGYGDPWDNNNWPALPLAHEFYMIRDLPAGNHNMSIRFVTSGLHGTLAGEMTDLEWYK